MFGTFTYKKKMNYESVNIYIDADIFKFESKNKNRTLILLNNS